MTAVKSLIARELGHISAPSEYRGSVDISWSAVDESLAHGCRNVVGALPLRQSIDSRQGHRNGYLEEGLGQSSCNALRLHGVSPIYEVAGGRPQDALNCTGLQIMRPEARQALKRALHFILDRVREMTPEQLGQTMSTGWTVLRPGLCDQRLDCSFCNEACHHDASCRNTQLCSCLLVPTNPVLQERLVGVNEDVSRLNFAAQRVKCSRYMPMWISARTAEVFSFRIEVFPYRHVASPRANPILGTRGGVATVPISMRLPPRSS